jgi:hypothetical protein
MNFMRQTLETSNKAEVRVNGGFSPNGSSDPTAFFGRCISSVAHTSTGVWTVTLKNEFKGMSLYGKYLSVQLAASADVAAHFGAYDRDAGTLVIRNLTGGSLADIAAATDNYIFFELVARYDDVKDGTPTYDT